jgi:hypothetical protein
MKWIQVASKLTFVTPNVIFIAFLEQALRAEPF